MIKLLRFLAISIFLATPLVFSTHTSLTFEIPKVAVFRILLAVLMIANGIWIWLQKPKLKIPSSFSFPLIALASFAGIVILSTVFSSERIVSLFGSYFRQQGLITYLAYFAWLGILLWLLQAQTFLKKIPLLFASIGGIISSFALLDWLLPSILNFTNREVFLGRVFFPIGHPNFLAQTLLLILPFTLLVIFETKGKWKSWGIALAALQITTLTLTASRAAFMGIWLAVVVIFCAKKLWKKLSGKIFASAWIGIPLVIIAVVNFFPAAFTTTPLARLDFGSNGMQSIFTRNALLEVGVKLIETKPLLGYGVDTLETFSPSKLTPQLFLTEKFQDIPDRLHSEILDYAYSFGIPAMLLYYVFLGSVITLLLRKPTPLKLACATALLSHTFAAWFGFAVTTDSVFLWGILAVSLVATQNAKFLNSKISPRLIAAILIILGGGILWWSNQLLQADLAFSQGKAENNLSAKIQAVTLGKNFPAYHLSLIATLANAKSEAATRVLEMELQQAEKLFPQNTEIALARGKIETLRGNFQAADIAFAKASELSPLSFEVWWSWGESKFLAGDTEATKAKWGKILEFAPPYWRWKDSLEKHSATERNRYRIFFQENPDFETFLHEWEKLNQR
ncbi:MAG: O-antigen ligase family protein [Candidatus Gracilibacteria bacterium]|nr:O-antigen ligase family protein [Candidatus Gracilibacteria bacterium]MDD5179587.1 O-antigen ligase family protein [Candidatus Gracilibacteria bacterium]